MMGRILFYIFWPLIWLYAPLARRARAVVIYEGKILVVKNWLGPGSWQLPGGGIKMGESVTGAVVREVNEELGLKAGLMTELHTGFVIHRQFGLLMRYHFVATDIIKPSRKLVSCHGIVEASWLPIDDLPKVSPEVTRAIALVSKV